MVAAVSSDAPTPAAADYWQRPGLTERILEALAAAGKDVDNLTVDDNDAHSLAGCAKVVIVTTDCSNALTSILTI